MAYIHEILTPAKSEALEDAAVAVTMCYDVWVVALPMENGWNMVEFFYPAEVGPNGEWGTRREFAAPVSVPFKSDSDLFDFALIVIDGILE